MITPLTPRNLKRLRSEESVIEHFIGLVTMFLAGKPARRDTITEELSLLIELCNHHRNLLWQIYRHGEHSGPEPLKDWLYELATPPSGDWAELRLALTPFIRSFGKLPRPKGTRLFSEPEQAAMQVPDSGDAKKALQLVAFEAVSPSLRLFPDEEAFLDPAPAIDAHAVLPPVPFQATVATPA